MSQITFREVGFKRASDMYSGVNFSFNQGDRIGIVGNNGIGKSTLLKCVLGDIEPTEGQVVLARNQRIGSVGQDLPDDIRGLTMADALLNVIPEADRTYEYWKVDVLLDDLGVSTNDRIRKVRDLSGGWQRIVSIAGCFLQNPDIILLDEPTNHLDLSKILWLENSINSLSDRVTVVIISHDRAFLDNTTHGTLFLRAGRSKAFPYSYSRAMNMLEQYDQEIRNLAEKTTVKLKRLEKSAANLRQIGVDNYSDAALRKAVQIRKRADQLKESIPDVVGEERRDIILSNRDIHQRYMVELKKLVVHDPNKKALFRIDHLVLAKGDRLVVFGENGAGKSQFVKLLSTEIELPRSSRREGISITAAVNFCYLDQHLSFLPGNIEVFDHLRNVAAVGDDRCRATLVNAGFSLPMQKQKIGTISHGNGFVWHSYVFVYMPPTYIFLTNLQITSISLASSCWRTRSTQSKRRV